MCPRRYRGVRRKLAFDETRGRIVAATAALHAEHGIRATTYAMIARHADVAVHTVYNHFPTFDELQAACSGQVLAEAPTVGPQIFAGLADLETRLRALVRALSAFYRFMAPWLRWTYYEARFVPEIAPRYRKAAEQRRALIEEALAPTFGPQPPAAQVAVCECLLEFPAWQRLTLERGLSDDEAEVALAAALAAVANAHAAASAAGPHPS